MFQQAFGFVRLVPIPLGLAQNSSVLAPQPAGSAPPRGRLAPTLERVVPCPERPFLSSARVTNTREQFARPRTASHTRRQASSTKNLSPSRSTGCASRSAHPCNDAAPAEPRTAAPRRYTPG